MEISIYNQNFVYLEVFKYSNKYFNIYFNSYSVSPISARNSILIKGFDKQNKLLNGWDESQITILLNITYIRKCSFSLVNNICLYSVLSGLDISQVPKSHRLLNIANEYFKLKDITTTEKRAFLRKLPIPEETNDKGSFTLITDKYTSDEYIDFLINNLIIKNSDKRYTYLDKYMLNLIPTEYSLLLRDFVIEQNKKL
jgi:hypothetical protein